MADGGGAELEILEERAAASRRRLETHPEDAEAWIQLGLALAGQGAYAEAEAPLRRGLVNLALNTPARQALAECLLRRGDLSQAIHQLERVLRAEPANTAAFRRLVDTYTACRDRTALLDVLDRWIAVDPGSPELRWERGTMRLMEGRLREGWEDIEARFEIPDQVVSFMGPFSQPRWNGEPFPGKTLLLHWEQGLGDTIMFVRYASRVKALGGRVVAVVQPMLVDLVATCEGIDDVVADEAPLPPFDLHLPLMSLPRVFGTEEATIPAEIPYLGIPPHAPNRDALHGVLSVPTQRVRIGYAWTGSPRHLNNAIRSMPFDKVARLEALSGVAWHCFQMPPPEALPLPSVPLGPLLSTFSDTAYALSFMDLVITVDTALAHVAGALGLPTFLVLPFGSEWRWQWDRPDSPWYPTMRIYRQPAPGDWDTPIDEMLADLSAEG
ncbi:tetratricopeptide repeat protein [Geothrix sp. 21YS21S-4]|uniref:tetratricopeptide repeat protein n=1 Tax=Geothrix sp. 21YS21S-4 TaxID=3068889 RepID=UPI0027BAE3C0|nr:hypothetical protein [Geothrix sp. 21YS21S-4]